MNRLLAFLLVVLSCVCCTKTLGDDEGQQEGIKYEGGILTITPSSFNIGIGETVSFVVDYNEGKWCERVKGAKIEVSDNQMISVSADEGTPYSYIVTGLTKGNTKFKVTFKDKFSTESDVTVNETIDLGLSVDWACLNIGAKSVSDYGTTYHWGGISESTACDWQQYRFSLFDEHFGTLSNFSKYDNVDGLVTLESEDDIATISLSEGYRMPTKAETEELLSNCEHNWVKISESPVVYGMKFVSKVKGYEKKCIVLPVSEREYYGPTFGDPGYHYWTSSLKSDDIYKSYEIYFDNNAALNYCGISEAERRNCRLIRPVKAKQQN